MKKLTALVLALTLLLGCCAAGAEELPYIWELPEDYYVNTFLLTPESCPRACISPYYADSMYASNYHEHWFVTFDAPAGAQPSEFTVNDIYFIDETNNILYYYQAHDSFAYETFLNRCNDSSNIIYNGDGGRAAYIEPDRSRAYALIALPAVSNSAKLYFSITMNHVGKSVAAQTLTDAVKAEIDRLQSGITAQIMPRHWTDGAYAGVKKLSTEFDDLMLVIDTPELKSYDENGVAITANMFVTEIGGKSVTGYAIFFEDCSVKVTISLETYTYINSRKEKDPENVFSVILNNGLQFDVYMYGLKEKGQSSMVYASCVLANNAGYHQDELYYLNIDMDGHNVHWSSPADVAADLEDIVRKMRIANPYEEVYVPTAPIVEPAPAVEPAPIVEPVPAVEPAPAADDGKWICPSCNAENNGNFCANCGTKKPDGKWICPSCNAENSGNFCTNCGSKKP